MHMDDGLCHVDAYDSVTVFGDVDDREVR